MRTTVGGSIKQCCYLSVCLSVPFGINGCIGGSISFSLLKVIFFYTDHYFSVTVHCELFSNSYSFSVGLFVFFLVTS